MPLNAVVKMDFSKNIEFYEGRIPHLYLDTKGNVTVGVGHMVPNRMSMTNLTMYKKSANNALTLATPTDKYAEYDTIKKQMFGRDFKAASFKKYTTLIMKDADINIHKEKHLQDFYIELSSYYSKKNGFSTNFDAMPTDVQKALLDMGFNLGLTKLKNQYIQMNTFIKQEKWADAGIQSGRMGIDASRNGYVKALFNAAANSRSKP